MRSKLLYEARQKLYSVVKRTNNMIVINVESNTNIFFRIFI